MRRGAIRCAALLGTLLLWALPARAQVQVQVVPPTGGIFTCQPAPVAIKVARPLGTGPNLVLLVNEPAVPGKPTLVLRQLGSAGTTVGCPPGGKAGDFNTTCDGASPSFTAAFDNDAIAVPDLVATLYSTQAGNYSFPLQAACDGGCSALAPVTLSVTDYPLHAEITPETSSVAPGGSLVLDIHVRDDGELGASGVVFDLSPLPAGATLSGISLNGAAVPSFPVTVGTLAAHSEAVIKVTLVATGLADGASLAFTGRLHGTADGFLCPTVNGPSVTVSVSGLVLEKFADVTHARPGDTVKWTVRVSTPAGTLPPGTSISDLLPSQLVLEHLYGAIGGAWLGELQCPRSTAAGELAVSCPLENDEHAPGGQVTVALPSGKSVTGPLELTLVTRVAQGASGSVVNIAQASQGTGSPTSSVPVMVTIDGASQLVLTADRALATRGDLVPLRARVAAGASPIGASQLAFRLGRDLRPAGAVRLLNADGSTLSTAQPSESGTDLIVPLPALPAGQTLTAVMNARVAAVATLGRKTPLVIQEDPSGRAVASASTLVEITAEPDFDLATLAGTVFRDDNGDGKRSKSEPGLSGVMLVMEDGLTTYSDDDGRYHVAAVVPGQRVLKVAAHTLPPGARLTGDGTRVLTVTPGIVMVVDFPVAIAAPVVPPRRDGPAMGPGKISRGPSGIVYTFTGFAGVGGLAFVGDRVFPADASGNYAAEVALVPRDNRFLVAVARADGHVEVAARTVRWGDRGDGTGFVEPIEDQPRLSLVAPAALAEGDLPIEGEVEGKPSKLVIGGKALVPDANGRIEARLPVASAIQNGALAIEVAFDDGLAMSFRRPQRAPADFALLVGIAEGKIGYVIGSGAQSDPGLYASGRVALYARGRIQGKWLLEGGLDLDSTQISNWRDLFRGDPTRAFRALDPDKFYPVYGDTSATAQHTPSRGPLYVKIAVDGSDLTIGNVQTGLTGVEMGRYQRTVTGGRLDYVRAGPVKGGPPDTQLIVFGAWLPSSRAHDELRGTGGSLYYLSHRAVVEGSEQLRIEIRDQVSDRPIDNRALARGVDYEIDQISGRLLLRDPLSSVGAASSLVRSSTVDGARAYLIADYEYVVVGDSDDATVGGRATQRLGPVRLGATGASEIRSGGNWWLAGGDAKVDLGRYGQIVGEFAHSSGSQGGFQTSDDGGLTFATPASATQTSGNAWKVEADLHGFGFAIRPYVRSIDRGFNDTAHVPDQGLLQVGGEATGDLLGAHLRLHVDQRWLSSDVGRSERTDAGGDLGRRFGRVEITIGARSQQVEDGVLSARRTDLAAKVAVDVHPRVTLYALGQLTVDKSGDPSQTPLAKDGSLGALGLKLKLPWDITANGEGSYGSSGFGGLVGLKTPIGGTRVLYGTYSVSQDRDSVVSTSLAIGGRERLGPAMIFAEDQFRDGNPNGLDDATKGRSHVDRTGVELPLSKRLALGATYEHGEVSGTADNLSRDSGSLHFSYVMERLQAQAKVEVRRDVHPGADAPLQLVLSASATFKATSDLTLRAKVFTTRTTTSTAQADGLPNPLASSTQIDVGFSYRPSWIDGAALFGRYAYLDDGPPPVQQAGVTPTFHERAHIGSLGGEARLFWRLSLGEKIAVKRREEDVAGSSPQILILWVNRLSVHVTSAWDGVVEYRLVGEPGAQTQQGVALEVNRLLVGHLRIGVGWNFSQVTDDELKLGRGSENGFFVRAQGYY